MFHFSKASNNPAFHPFRKLCSSEVGILWAGIPQVLREHRRRKIFPEFFGGLGEFRGEWAVQPQRQLVWPLNATHSEITQVGSPPPPEELESKQ